MKQHFHPHYTVKQWCSIKHKGNLNFPFPLSTNPSSQCIDFQIYSSINNVNYPAYSRYCFLSLVRQTQSTRSLPLNFQLSLIGTPDAPSSATHITFPFLRSFQRTGPSPRLVLPLRIIRYFRLYPRQTLTLEHHLLSAVRDTLFNVSAVTFHIWKPSPALLLVTVIW